MLFGVVRHALGQLLGVGQKEARIERTRLIEYVGSRLSIGPFAGIDAPLFSFAEMECELRGPCCLSHLAFPLLRTEVLSAFQCRMLGHLCQAFGRSPIHYNLFTNNNLLTNTPFYTLEQYVIIKEIIANQVQ